MGELGKTVPCVGSSSGEAMMASVQVATVPGPVPWLVTVQLTVTWAGSPTVRLGAVTAEVARSA